ncbi:putative RNA methyltransferase [Alkaliphilus sp. B6464]|uniref:putative RNA methyltransferase n=1 Tax=Alkaliphilus sp. B6464 TaxID=2731219 RepID=UPI001BA85245|nr:methyltransferase domain-containing protein [Alkaliphilus sp. B6464]QUH21317.1 methyltransferase domain-containing protein [Alkaliphilus sp. B6464]
MKQKGKLEKAKLLFEKNIKIFRCPICKDNMKINDKSSLICNNNHCFDISKKGYVNLANRSSNKIYGKDLFESRNKIYNDNFYDRLITELVDIVDEYTLYKNKNYILDTGCGEGHYLNQLSKSQNLSNKYDFVGIDISKDGISIATREGNDIIWCVSDLSNLPFQTCKFDVVLNILSPANYEEFIRVLDNKGIVIKVIPESGYLKEIRCGIQNKIKSNNYSNKNVIEVFQQHLEIVSEKRLNYKCSIDESNLKDLIKMTPLTSSLREEEKDDLIKLDISSLTIDLRILVGRRKK